MIKKQKRLILIMLALVAVGLAAYFIFLSDPIDQPDDKIKIKYMYDEIKMEEIERIEVHNEHGDYTLVPYVQDATHSFYIKGYASYPLKPEILAYLKAFVLTAPVVYDDDTGEAKMFTDVTEEELAAFGLDEASDPAYYEIYLNGIAGATKYVRVYIGRSMYTTKQSYYVMLESDRTTVYQIFHTLDRSILQPVTSYISPVVFDSIAYENNSSVMYQVGEFRLSQRDANGLQVILDSEVATKSMEDGTVSYRIKGTHEELDLSRMFSGCLNNILTGMVGDTAIALSPDEETLDRYGLGANDPSYEIYVTYAKDYSDKYDHKLNLRVSALQEDGYYYLMSAAHDQVLTRVPASTFECFGFNFENWVSSNTFHENITNITSMTVQCEGYMNDTFDIAFDMNGEITVTSEATGMIWRDTSSNSYNKNNFRSFFMVLLTNTNWEKVTNVSEEEMEAALNNPDALLMTLRVEMMNGKVKEYKYYRISQFYAAVAVDGEFRYESNLNHMDYMKRAMTYLYEGKTINYLSFFEK